MQVCEMLKKNHFVEQMTEPAAKKKRVPKGWSSYQAAWLLENSDGEEEFQGLESDEEKFENEFEMDQESSVSDQELEIQEPDEDGDIPLEEIIEDDEDEE